MKYTVAVLALLGLITREQVSAIQIESGDWTDLLDKQVFNEGQYSSDNPDGYTSAVDEVF